MTIVFILFINGNINNTEFQIFEGNQVQLKCNGKEDYIFSCLRHVDSFLDSINEKKTFHEIDINCSTIHKWNWQGPAQKGGLCQRTIIIVLCLSVNKY